MNINIQYDIQEKLYAAYITYIYDIYIIYIVSHVLTTDI